MRSGARTTQGRPRRQRDERGRSRPPCRRRGVGDGFSPRGSRRLGIMAERLAGGNIALALLANAGATGTALFALILVFGPISGAHFQPRGDDRQRGFGRDAVACRACLSRAQALGAIAGVWLAHLMFDLPILQISTRERSGIGQLTGEFVATFGLLAVIESGRTHFPKALAGAVAAYIGAAYWFTSSTSFANPAVTLARSLSNSFAGIAPADVAGFIAAQLAGASAAVLVFRWFGAVSRSRMTSIDWLPASLLAASPVRELASGEALFRQGDASYGIFAVEHGRVQLLRHATEDRTLILHSARAGEFFAEAALYSEIYHCDAVCGRSDTGAHPPQIAPPRAAAFRSCDGGALHRASCAPGPSAADEASAARHPLGAGAAQ